MSTVDPGYLVTNLVDNSIGNGSVSTLSEALPWMNIQLLESGMIRTVAIFTRPDFVNRIATTSIRVGTDPNLLNNAVCKGSII